MNKKKSNVMRMPVEAKIAFMNKQEVLNQIAREEKLKIKKVTFADTLRFFSQKRIPVYNVELINFLDKKKNRKRMKSMMV